MIVMALLGGTEEDGDASYLALVNELGASRVRRLFLGYLPDPAERARRLRLEISGRWPDDIVTLVVGTNSKEELQVLRSFGAFVCHQYGALSEFYSQHGIKHHDLMVSEGESVPDHVLNTVEAWSECYVRQMDRRRKRREQKKRTAA
ncbi:hypothetical protein R7D97_25100 [Vibrio sp. Vb5031]|uniref:hypothetical protein n=1 Tax=Vibrio TaxID=662 RepID=UPI001C9CA3D2|nr:MULTISPECIES: hypothetical protein [Vibrio]EJV5951094.1 hypothetical protein [Vibrio alginolyticus]MBY7933427.1 hypothetical protein [Vibrio fluvialis]ELA7323134.1 hypothetical protein [Vibrio parahaemolyticus]MCI9687449.1 hypothetical protein [Vibrio parahaemolyticus]MDG2757455.1 hypothetical protein [Vibrio parahaemolyticus]